MGSRRPWRSPPVRPPWPCSYRRRVPASHADSRPCTTSWYLPPRKFCVARAHTHRPKVREKRVTGSRAPHYRSLSSLAAFASCGSERMFARSPRPSSFLPSFHPSTLPSFLISVLPFLRFGRQSRDNPPPIPKGSSAPA
jgi:hypothetical protein